MKDKFRAKGKHAKKAGCISSAKVNAISQAADLLFRLVEKIYRFKSYLFSKERDLRGLHQGGFSLVPTFLQGQDKLFP